MKKNSRNNSDLVTLDLCGDVDQLLSREPLQSISVYIGGYSLVKVGIVDALLKTNLYWSWLTVGVLHYSTRRLICLNVVRLIHI